MDILIEDELVSLALLIYKKAQLEKQLKKTIKCLLRKCFKCLGMKVIEEQLIEINEEIKQLRDKPVPPKKLIRTSSI
tara:strand:- start:9448 stop:9678 length:231 start_codon:yes stop_codon:yes gene_type:complete